VQPGKRNRIALGGGGGGGGGAGQQECSGE
jgi:hypothetical protein